jgi:hypothetical protein
MSAARTRSSRTGLFARALIAACVAGVLWMDGAGSSERAGSAEPVSFRMREVAARSGLDFVHRPCAVDPRLENLAPHITALGASVAVCDADGDGHPDLFATSSAFGSASALWLNDGAGNFRDAAAEAGLAQLSAAGEGAAMGSVWADADNDGDQDAFVYRYGHTALFENLGGARFREIGAQAGVRTWINSNAACWLDYDRDGLLDLFVAGYFHERVDLWDLADTRIMQSSFEFAENGGRNRLFRNLGGLRFEETTERAGIAGTRWTMAAAGADFDGDGWCDLYLANDYGPEEFLRNTGDGSFEARGDVGLSESSKSGMCVAVGDFENSGELGVFVTNISRRGFLFQGNNLRRNRLGDASRPRFVNLSDAASSVLREVTDCGWAWGAQFGDLDNDGRADLFVANGFISADRESEYWYDMAKVAGGAGDLFQDALNWPPIGTKSLSGYERSRVLWNRGPQRFQEVGLRVGVDDELDGRAVAVADLAGRGALDVIVANQGGPLLIYRSEPSDDSGWIQVRARGSRSNRDAIGARVELRLDDGTLQTQAVLAGSGFSAQNDLTLHFGLGAGRAIAGVSVVWPSGERQDFGALAARQRHVLVEALP